MGHPPSSVTFGVGKDPSSDGHFYARYPRGDKFALRANVQIRKTPSGVIDSHYPDGDDRASEIPLTWNTSSMPTLENLTTGGASFSVNVRAMLSEPGSPSATITVETLSGDNAASEGWSISGNNLVNPLSDAGAGVLRLAAVRNGVTVYSLPLVWSKQAAAPADTLAPIIVTGLTATPAVGQVILAWDASSDPHDGTTAGALKEYDVKLGAAVVHTLAAVAGLSPKLAAHTIGTVSPSVSAVQTGSSWAVTTAGTGFYAASDSGVFVGAQVTGDFTLTLKLASMTMPVTTCGIGPQVRESLDPTAKLVHIFQTSSVANVGLRARARLAAGQAAAIVADAPGVQPANWLRIRRASNVFTLSYSLDGVTFAEIASATVAMGPTAYVGFAASSGVNDTTFTSAVQQVNLTAAPRPSYSHTTAVGGAYSIIARDIALNVAAASASVTAAPIVSAITRRWTPGVYMSLRGHPQAFWPSAISGIAGVSQVKGVLFDYEWKNVEVAPGVYDFTQIAADFALVKAAGKQFWCRINSRVFGSADPDRRVVPDDLYPSGQVRFANGGWAARIFEAPVMDRLIACFRAVFAQFDADPYFEGMGTDETALTFSTQYPPPSGYSNTALKTQFERLAACRTSSTKAHLWISGNYLGSDALMEDLIQKVRLNKAAGGGPDTWKREWVEDGTRALQWDEILRGDRGTLHDYRPEIVVINEAQGTELGGYIANFTPAQVYDTAVNINRCNYFFVDNLQPESTPNGNAGNQWNTGFLPYIISVGGVTNTTLPIGY